MLIQSKSIPTTPDHHGAAYGNTGPNDTAITDSTLAIESNPRRNTAPGA